MSNMSWATGSSRDRRGCLRLRLPAGADGCHVASRPRSRSRKGPRRRSTSSPTSSVPGRHVHRRRQPERRHALLLRLARLGERADLLSVPETGKRYYLMQILDAWTERVRLPRNAHHRQREGRLRHRRAAWKGKLPEGVKEINPRRTWSGSSVARRPTARRTMRRSTPSRSSTR